MRECHYQFVIAETDSRREQKRKREKTEGREKKMK